ncbi:AAA family ATPase [Flindersiella endophytica]
MTILLEPHRATAESLAFTIGDDDVAIAGSLPALTRIMTDRPDDQLVVIGPSVEVETALEFAEEERVLRPVLGVILIRHRVVADLLVRALRAGVREVVQADDAPGLAAACARSHEVSHQLSRAASTDSAGQARRGRVVTVFSGKGGSGKTTVATNLAAQLADGGRRKVCLVDLDLQFGDLAIALQLQPVRTIVEAQQLGEQLDDAALRGLVVNHSPGLDALLAPTEPSQADHISPALVGDVLRAFTSMYEFVVVDTPPSFTDQVLAAIDRTDLLLLVTTPDIPAVKNLRLAIDMIRLLGVPDHVRKVVLNRADSNVGVTGDDVEQLAKTTIAAQIPSSRAVPAAINRGEILSLVTPKHPVSKAFRHFVEAQFGPSRGHQEDGGRLAGVLRRRKAVAA